MTSYRLPAELDPARPAADSPLTIRVDGEPVTGAAGQTIAGVLLGAGRRQWRTTADGAPRGVFCGIGVCFDCLVEVNGLRDVRACLRRAQDGDVVARQGGSEATA
ncbi:2Fe-2S iron-sulfur cluster binding domain-containing protein [Promicromonospora umidemergens]|uniref:(2Fe-2S)-binding protein n=1 Tax=Promicromonospora umidemergens TaxID=629679 RepID=A0ABP8XY00_9MICO|nr:(2Fe-2S)-binding protein [Promicromonospora umidemergens]MCP2286186.1 2Fe-2S iron-sulfur cluster binding domain-containing protein [Promicromonospora umidemergens]